MEDLIATKSEMGESSLTMAQIAKLTAHAGGPMVKKKAVRVSQACIRCKQRKQRCDAFEDTGDGHNPCRNCTHAGTECILAPRRERRMRNSVKKAVRKLEGPSAPVPDMAAKQPLQHPSPGVSDLVSAAQYLEKQNLKQPLPSSPFAADYRFENHPASPMYQRPQAFPDTLPKPMLPQHHGQPPQSQQVALSGKRSALPSPGTLSQTIASDNTSPVGSIQTSADSEVSATLSDEAARGVAFLALNSSGQPLYVGPSSGFTWAKLILGHMSSSESSNRSQHHYPAHIFKDPFKSATMVQEEEVLGDDALDNIPFDISASLLNQCYKHLQPRYPFLDWLSIHDYWTGMTDVVREAAQDGASKQVRTQAFFIWMLFAVGSRLLSRMQPAHLAPPEAYYAKAMQYLDVVSTLHDLNQVQALLLMAMYSFRSTEAPSMYHLVGIIMRLCLSLGLHRKFNARESSSLGTYEIELRKRIFWTTYILDRMMSMCLGRPLGISDSDIDQELPLDVDCIEPYPSPERIVAGKCTSMTSSIHFMKLTRIESLIHRTVYRVDRRPDVDAPDAFLKMLDDWEATIPKEASGPDHIAHTCCTRDWFMLKVDEARLFLLRPWTVDRSSEKRYVQLLSQYAADMCEVQKRLHRSAYALNLLNLRTIFLSGLTLLHAIEKYSDIVEASGDITLLNADAHLPIPASTLQRAIRAASNTLFMYIQMFPAGQAFHDTFEDLATLCLERHDARVAAYQERHNKKHTDAENTKQAQAEQQFPSIYGNYAQRAIADAAPEGVASPSVPQVTSPDNWLLRIEDMSDLMSLRIQDEFSFLLDSLGIPLNPETTSNGDNMMPMESANFVPPPNTSSFPGMSPPCEDMTQRIQNTDLESFFK